MISVSNTKLSMNGYLEIIIGPMFSGKTTSLINNYKNIINNNNKCAVITHNDDIRYSIDKLSSHDKSMIECFKYKSLEEFNEKCNDIIKNVDFILIDESQFFTDLYKYVLYFVNDLHKNVYLYGLDGDFKQKKFGQVFDIIPYCDKIQKLQSSCNNCNNPAPFSHRTSNSTEQVLIGSEDKYIPLCRSCLFQSNMKTTPHIETTFENNIL